MIQSHTIHIRPHNNKLIAAVDFWYMERGLYIYIYTVRIYCRQQQDGSKDTL